MRVGVVNGAEPQGVHDGNRARAHGHDVPDDAADAGRGALVGLDIRRVVVALDLEGHCPAIADVDDTGVLADTDQQLLLHLLRGVFAELREVHLR